MHSESTHKDGVWRNAILVLSPAINRLQNCILEVIKWMTSNALKINEKKNGIYCLQ